MNRNSEEREGDHRGGIFAKIREDRDSRTCTGDSGYRVRVDTVGYMLGLKL